MASTWFRSDHGNEIVCDANGKDCHAFIVTQPPVGSQDSVGGLAEEATTDVAGCAAPAPEVDIATPSGTLAGPVASEDEPEQDHTPSTKGKGKKGKHCKK